MPVSEDSSFVPDSTISTSPLITPAVKRPTRTYGRPRHVEPASDDSHTSLLHSAKSSGSRGSVYRTGPPDLNEEVPPSSDPAPALSDQDHADTEDEDAGSDASSGFQFSWRKKLQELDENDEFDVDRMGTAEAKNAFTSRVELDDDPALSPQRSQTTKTSHVPTSSIGSGIDALADEVFGGSLNTLTTSLASPHTSFSSTPESAPIHRRIKLAIYDSDSEDGDNKVLSPASPSFPHAITTPKLVSSPTPPTSNDDMLTHAKRDSKGKGKAKAPARPDVVPLWFSEDPAPSAIKPPKASSDDRRSKKQKIKAPTKKELTETARDRLRIAADQQVSIPRADAPRDFSVYNFFLNLRGAKHPPPEIDLDPIENFSDPVTSPTHMYVAPLPSTLCQSDGSPIRRSPRHIQRSPPKPMVSSLEVDDADDILPDVGTLLAQEQEKRENAKRCRELMETKMKALAAQSANDRSYDEDDDDGLEVVQSLDMQMAIKEEEAERKSGRKKRMSEGRKRQLNLGGIGLAKQKAKENLTRVSDLQILKAPGSQKGKKVDRPITQAELNRVLTARAEADRQEVIRLKEEEWKRRGGKTTSAEERVSLSVQDASTLYVEKGLKLRQGRPAMMDVDLDDTDGSDEDWAPEGAEERGSASPSPRPVDGGGGDREEDENPAFVEDEDITMVNEETTSPAPTQDTDTEELPKLPARRSLNKHIIDSDSEAENDENHVPAWTPSALAPSRLPTSQLKAQDSDDENVRLPPLTKPSMLSHRGSLSSMDDQTEDEGDKENETSRMWDRGDDKENKAVVRHASKDSRLSFRSSQSSLFGLEVGLSRGLSMSPDLDTHQHTIDEDAGEGGEDNRRPFKDLMDDPFVSPSRSTKLATSFEARLKQASPASLPLTPSLTLAPFIGSKDFGFSQFPDDESASVLGPAPLQPSFSDLFESGTEKQKAASLKRALGELSGSFSDESLPHSKIAGTNFASDLGLTQDITLQPALQVSGNLLRKADQIFEKEQEYVLEAANKKPQAEPELYVNDHGFLTQTRPDVCSPEVYRPPSPTQNNQSSESQSSLRRPLRTISLSDEFDFDSPAVLNRLTKRATTPTSLRLRAARASSSPSLILKRSANAFDVMKHAAKAHADKPKRKLEKSEFVEQEAQESDDDEMFGFGPRAKGKDDEEDGEDLDQTLETLVDDKDMDEETAAVQLVMEKYKEQAEADDLEVEKLHQAAIHGELRKKRRNRGIDMDDSDDDSEDEANRRIRRNMKKQRIDRDNIKALGEHEETKSFYDVYENDLIADNEDFKYLGESQPQDVVMANPEAEDEDEEPREFITRDEIQRRARELAEQPQDEDDEPLDPADVSWIDQDQSDEEQNLRVKAVHSSAKKRPKARRRGIDQMDFDVGFEMPLPKPVMEEGSIVRLQSWAKVEGRSRQNGTTGRNVGGAAVTGHKVKSGGGSLRNAASSASSASSKSSEQRRPVKAQPSLLASVAAERRSTRFG